MIRWCGGVHGAWRGIPPISFACALALCIYCIKSSYCPATLRAAFLPACHPATTKTSATFWHFCISIAMVLMSDDSGDASIYEKLCLHSVPDQPTLPTGGGQAGRLALARKVSHPVPPSSLPTSLSSPCLSWKEACLPLVHFSTSLFLFLFFHGGSGSGVAPCSTAHGAGESYAHTPHFNIAPPPCLPPSIPPKINWWASCHLLSSPGGSLPRALCVYAERKEEKHLAI